MKIFADADRWLRICRREQEDEFSAAYFVMAGLMLVLIICAGVAFEYLLREAES